MVKLNVDFRVEDARRALTEFAVLVGYSEMRRAIDKVHDEMNRRKATSIGLFDMYAIPLGLRRAYEYVRSTGRAKGPVIDPYTFAACTFANAAVSISRVLSPRARDRMVGMVRKSLTLQNDARELQHEFTVAAHFSHNGWDVTFVGLEGLGQFDYLVRKDGHEAEVECKAISADKGNAIHMLDALNFMDRTCEPLLSVFEEGWWTVDITFDVGLPRNPEHQIALARLLARSMRAGNSSCVFDGGSAALKCQPMPQLTSNQELQTFANETMAALQARLNGHAEAVCNRKRMLALATSSKRPSRVVDYSYRLIKGACEQLSGNRAGFVWTHFTGVSDKEMRMLAESKEATALEVFANRIFSEKNRSHVT